MSRAIGTRSLWFGVLAAPIAWSVQLAVDYMFDEWLSCTRGFRTPGVIWHLSTNGWIVITNLFFVGVILVALATATRNLRRTRVMDESPGKRAGFMAFIGVINSIVFLIPIVMAFVPALTLRRCVPTP